MQIPAGKIVDLIKLRTEAIAAGVALPRGLGRFDNELHTYTADGQVEDVPASMSPVLTAHDGTPPPPIDYGANAEDLDRSRIQAYITAANTYLGKVTAGTVTAADDRAQNVRNAKAILTVIKLVRGTNG